jgi:hypothetical protein
VNLPEDAPEAIEAVVEHYRVRSLLLIPEGEYGETTPWARGYLEEYGDRWERDPDALADTELYRRRAEAEPAADAPVSP